jgi:hypothetical protein
MLAWTTETLTTGAGVADSRVDAFHNQVALKLRDGGHNCEDGLAKRRTGVKVLLVGNKLDAE